MHARTSPGRMIHPNAVGDTGPVGAHELERFCQKGGTLVVVAA